MSRELVERNGSICCNFASLTLFGLVIEILKKYIKK